MHYWVEVVIHHEMCKQQHIDHTDKCYEYRLESDLEIITQIIHSALVI